MKERKTQYKLASEAINKISDELDKEWKEIRWELPTLKETKTIEKAIVTQANLLFLYRIIREISWAVDGAKSAECHHSNLNCQDCRLETCPCDCHFKDINKKEISVETSL